MRRGWRRAKRSGRCCSPRWRRSTGRRARRTSRTWCRPSQEATDDDAEACGPDGLRDRTLRRTGRGGPDGDGTYPASLAKGPLDGRLLLLLSTDDSAEPRFQISDGPRRSRSSASTSDGWKPGSRGGRRRGRPRLSAREPGAGPRRDLHRAGAAPPLRDLPPRRRPHGQAADGPRRGPAVEPRARATSTARRARSRSIRERRAPSRSRWTRRSRRSRPAGDEVHQARADPERAAHEVLGPRMYLGAHVLLPEGFDAHPQAATRWSINHGHFPHDFGGFREEPPDPDLKSEYRDRFQLDGYNRTQQEQAHQFYKDWTGPGFPRMLHHRDPARQPVLRRLLRGELGEPRALRRRDHLRADPVPREEVPRRSAPAGRASCTAARPAAGRRWPRRSSTRTSTTAAGPPAPIPSTSAPTPWWTSTRTRTPTGPRGPWLRVAAARACANCLGHVEPRWSRRTAWSWCSARRAARASSGTSGRRSTRRSGADGYPKRIWDKRTGVIDPKVGRALAGELRPRPHPAARLGEGPGPEARRARSTSTSATWTTTT